MSPAPLGTNVRRRCAHESISVASDGGIYNRLFHLLGNVWFGHALRCRHAPRDVASSYNFRPASKWLDPCVSIAVVDLCFGSDHAARDYGGYRFGLCRHAILSGSDPHLCGPRCVCDTVHHTESMNEFLDGPSNKPLGANSRRVGRARSGVFGVAAVAQAGRSAANRICSRL